MDRLAERTGGETGIGVGTLTPEKREQFYQKVAPYAERSEFDARALEGIATEETIGVRPWLDRDSAVSMISEAGFSESDIPISEFGANSAALSHVIKMKERERSRGAMIQQGSTGVGRSAASMVVALLTSMADPVNLAVSWIPVVGQARYASALANASSKGARALVRMRRGALEGAVGAALIEPVILEASSRDQLDYGWQDSLLNFAFGSAMGGGLHAGMGAIGDALSPRVAQPVGVTSNKIADQDFATKESMLRHSVGMMADDRLPDVDFILGAGSRGSFAEGAQRVDLAPRLVVDEEAARFVDADSGAIIDIDDMPAPLRERFAQVDGDVEKMQDLVADLARVDIRNAADLKRVMGKAAPIPMSTYLERQGGLGVDRARAVRDLSGDALIEGRPQLFRKKGGMDLEQAKKSAIEAGYIPEGTSTDRFAKLLSRDVRGERVFKAGDAADLEQIGRASRAEIQYQPVARVDAQTSAVWAKGMHAIERTRNYDAVDQADFQRLLNESPAEVDAASMEAEIANLEAIMDSAGVRADMTAADAMETKAEASLQAYDETIECLLENTK
jgi:hypothetical protein